MNTIGHNFDIPKDEWDDGIKKHWKQPEDVLAWTLKLAEGKKKILDVGPGEFIFPLATHTCGWQYGRQVVASNTIVDFTSQLLPYEDNEFDFVYCRHTLEDLTYPFLLLRELGRVGKAGYIETPSIMSELCLNIDASSPKYRGYHHHVWFTWVEKGVMNFCHKFPIIEYYNFQEDYMKDILKKYPHLWFNYLTWDGEPASGFRHHMHDRDFCLMSHPQLQNYEDFLAQKCQLSTNINDEFYRTHIAKNT
jgi:hypothetical protein